MAHNALLTWVTDNRPWLQNPDNKQIIMVKNDAKLHALFGVDECKGFGMAKYLAPHFVGPAEDT